MTRTTQLKLHEFRIKKKSSDSLRTYPDLILPSSLRDSLGRLEQFLESLREQISMEEQKFINLMVTLSEAITNAIVHGNRFQKNKHVFLKFNSNQQLLQFSVEDEGGGFDYSQIRDPFKGEDIYAHGGQGILIMKHLSDTFEYSKGGRRLDVGFRLR